jgi:hypothetical protein
MAQQILRAAALLRDDQPALTRLAPAGLLSLLSHAAIFGAFFLLMPTAPADTEMEAVPNEALVGVENPDQTRADPFNTDVVNEGSTERHQDPADHLDRLAAMTIPGDVNPLENPGLVQGSLDAVLKDFPHPKGFGERGAGGGLDLPGTEATFNPFDPGGYRHGGMLDIKDAVKGRSAVTREKLVNIGGGTDASEAAVTRGLRWLVRQQFPNGSWRLDGAFPDKGAQNDVAATALGLLPFLGAGKTHRAGKDNLFDKPVEKGLLYLMGKQDKKTGNLGGGMYGHALATIALCEAYSLTQDPPLRRPAQLAVNFIVAAQHDAGGWRYAPLQAGDTSVTGWQIMALKSAEMAGLEVSPLTLKKAQRYLDSCVSPADEGYGYTGVGSTPTLSAVGLLCRQFIQGWGPQNLRLIKGIGNHLRPNPPGAKRDAYYTYYATQVMFHFGGEGWKLWNAKMLEALLKEQVADNRDPLYGSWSSTGDVHGSTGGRLMVTSLNLLSLEVYYRYLPLYKRSAAASR